MCAGMGVSKREEKRKKLTEKRFAHGGNNSKGRVWEKGGKGSACVFGVWGNERTGRTKGKREGCPSVKSHALVGFPRDLNSP